MRVGVELARTSAECSGDLVSGRSAADPELGVEVVDRLPNRHGTILRRENGVVTSWREVETAAPALAAALKGRFAAHKHALLATLRRDGSPRISGIETSFRNGELWLAMMPDAKLNGRAIEVTDPAELERFVAGLGQAPPPSGVGLLRADLTDASLTRVEGDWLVIDSWREGEGPRQRRRQ